MNLIHTLFNTHAHPCNAENLFITIIFQAINIYILSGVGTAIHWILMNRFHFTYTHTHTHKIKCNVIESVNLIKNSSACIAFLLLMRMMKTCEMYIIAAAVIAAANTKPHAVVQWHALAAKEKERVTKKEMFGLSVWYRLDYICCFPQSNNRVFV